MAFHPTLPLLMDELGQTFDFDLNPQLNAAPEIDAASLENYPSLHRSRYEPFFGGDGQAYLATIASEYRKPGILLRRTEDNILQTAWAAPVDSDSHTVTRHPDGTATIATRNAVGQAVAVRTDRNGVAIETIQLGGQKRIFTHQHTPVVNPNGKSFLTRTKSNTLGIFGIRDEVIQTLSFTGPIVDAGYSDSGELRYVVARQSKSEESETIEFFDEANQSVAREPKSKYLTTFPQHEHVICSPDDRYAAMPAVDPEHGLRVQLIDLRAPANKTKHFAIDDSTKSLDRFEMSFSSDAKWLAMRARIQSSQECVLWILNLSSDANRFNQIGGQTLPFQFVPGADQLVCGSTIYDIFPSGELSKNRSAFPSKSSKGWATISLSPNDSEPSKHRYLVASNFRHSTASARSPSFAWIQSNDFISEITNIPKSLWYPQRTIGYFDSGVRPIRYGEFTAFIPDDPAESMRSVFVFDNESVLTIDYEGRIHDELLKTNQDDYFVRLLRYPGGRVIPLREAQWNARLQLSEIEKQVAYLQDLGADVEFSEDGITSVKIAAHAELTADDLRVLEECSDTLEQLTFCNGQLKTLQSILEGSTPLRLQKLNLAGTQVGTMLPKLLKRCTRLQELNLISTGATCWSTGSLGEHKQLTKLHISEGFCLDTSPSDVPLQLPQECQIKTHRD